MKHILFLPDYVTNILIGYRSNLTSRITSLFSLKKFFATVTHVVDRP